jgi:hypothetical protein
MPNLRGQTPNFSAARSINSAVYFADKLPMTGQKKPGLPHDLTLKSATIKHGLG